MPPKISVVLPFHDVEDHLAECLESLARQTLRDLEVIMVDDGSADGGAVVAKEFAGRDDRFVLVQRDHEGPGPARNAGIERATGQFLAFADGDGALPPYAYELMAGTLETTGSDLVGGNVLRLDGERVWQSWLHTEPYARTVRATHITRHPVLLQDRIVWNKVYRRSFWDAHRFEFPAMLFEDTPVSIEAHVRASAVDVLDTTVYFWRRRPAALTRRRQEMAGITDRMASLEMVRAVLGDHAPALLPIYDMYALDLDVRALVRALPAASEAERATLAGLGAEIVEGSAPAAFGGLEAIRRLEMHLLREGMLPELLDVLRLEEDGPHDVPIAGRGRLRQRWYARYPFFGDPERGVPDEVYEVTGEFRLRAEVDRVRWDAGALVVEGHAHFNRLEVAAAGDSRIRVWMRDVRAVPGGVGGRPPTGIRTGKEIRLPVERIRCPAATARSGQSLVSYDWSGFRVRIDPGVLQEGDEWRTATFELLAEVTTAGHRAVQRLACAVPAVNWAPARQVDEHVAVRPVADDGFVVHVKRAKAVVTGHRRAGDALELTGWTRRALGAGAALVAARRHGGAEVRGEVTLRPAAGMRLEKGTGFDFTATLPLGDLLSHPDAAEFGSCGAHLRDSIDWDLRLTGAGGPIRLTVARNLAGARYACAGREFALTRTAFGNLRGIERSFRPVVTCVRWDPDGRLTVTGDLADPGHRPDHLILRHRRSGDEHRVPLTWGDGRFTAALTPGRMPLFGAEVPLTSGDWEFFGRTAGGGEVAVVVERGVISRLPGWRPVGVHEIEAGVHQIDALLLRVRTALGEDERGPHAQRILRERDYPVYLRSPLADVAVFDSYGASQYNCNPRAIYEELTRRHSGLECVWISKDGQVTPEGDAKTVLAGSREHYRTLARARYIVTNYGLPAWYTKRPGQTYMQTWHGTPVKRIAHDLRDMPYKRAERLDWVDHEVPRWDVLLSPNPFTTRVMRRALRYEGEILESGYPRNDILSRSDFNQAGARIRKRLGVPKGRKVVLYAPTWRDDLHHAPGRRGFSLELDVDALRRALGDDHVLLLRTHHLITDRDRPAPEIRPAADGFVIDVSRYPDVAELYLAADVLVTDYSSAMVDFACTGRPMLFHTYDLERYRDHVRGFSLDLEAEAPGPLLPASAEIAEALRAIDDVQDAHVDAYDAFFDAYCPHDDGQAAARAVDRLLG